MYAYCNNNPVINVDSTGESLTASIIFISVIALIGTIAGGVFAGGTFLGTAPLQAYSFGAAVFNIATFVVPLFVDPSDDVNTEQLDPVIPGSNNYVQPPL